MKKCLFAILFALLWSSVAFAGASSASYAVKTINSGTTSGETDHVKAIRSTETKGYGTVSIRGASTWAVTVALRICPLGDDPDTATDWVTLKQYTYSDANADHDIYEVFGPIEQGALAKVVVDSGDFTSGEIEMRISGRVP